MDVEQLINAPKAAPTIMARNTADELDDGEVASIKPVATITHEETGFSGPDFVPGKPIKRIAAKPSSNIMPEQIYSEPTDEDYIPPGEAARRSKIRSELAKRYKENILKENKHTAEKYEKASRIVTAIHAKYGANPVIHDEAILEKYRRALEILSATKPLSDEEAERQAMYKAATEAIGREG